MRNRPVVIGVVLFAAGSAVAQPQFDYTRIIGTGDALPGATWQFGGYRAPEYSQGVMYFEGRSSDGSPESGLYRYADGQLNKIFLEGDTIASTGRTILGLGLPNPNGSEFMVEIGTSEGSSYSSDLYRYGDGQLTEVFRGTDFSLPGPADDDSVYQLQTYSPSVNNVGYFATYVYSPSEPRQTNLFRYDDNGVSLFLDGTTTIPGTDGITIDAVNGINYDGTNLAFFAGNSPTSNGFFVYDGSEWESLGSQNDIANIIGTTSMGIVGKPQYADGVFAVNMNWHSDDRQRYGIFLLDGQTTTKVVDTNTVSPEGGRFRSFFSIAQDNGEIVFDGRDTLGNAGIYRTFNGALATVINTGDVLDGKTVQSVSFGKKAIFGDEIAFSVSFDDNTYAYYLAPVIRGSDQIVPIVSTQQVINGIQFNDVATQAWIDSLRIADFKLDVFDFADEALLSEDATAPAPPESINPLIVGLTLPVGYGDMIQISADGQQLGTFGEGESVDIETMLGAGVESISFAGFQINGETVGAEGVPVQLLFNTESASIVATSLESLLGDLNGDGALTNGDISAFVQALTDPAGYATAFPGLNPDTLGDYTGDGSLTNGDIAGFVAALTGGSSAIPEPTSLAMLGLSGMLLTRRLRR